MDQDAEQFVFIDFETTGLDPVVDRVIEVAALLCSVDGREHGRYQTLVNPGVPVPERITELTGIDTPLIQRDGITSSNAIIDLQSFIGGRTVVAFNAEFDEKFLLAETQRTMLEFPPLKFVCALKIARQAWPIFRQHNLRALSMFFSLPQPTHRAMDDCVNGSQIFLKAASTIWNEKILTHIESANLFITAISIENLYECKDGDELELWTRPDFPRINAYSPYSEFGSGLVVSLEKQRDPWLVEKMAAGEVSVLRLDKEPGKNYAVYPIQKGEANA